jgi:hypothetical protein
VSAILEIATDNISFISNISEEIFKSFFKTNIYNFSKIINVHTQKYDIENFEISLATNGEFLLKSSFRFFQSFYDNSFIPDSISVSLSIENSQTKNPTINNNTAIFSMLSINKKEENFLLSPLSISLANQVITDSNINYDLSIQANISPKIIDEIPSDYIRLLCEIKFIENNADISDLNVPLISIAPELEFRGIAILKIIKTVLIATANFEYIRFPRKIINTDFIANNINIPFVLNDQKIIMIPTKTNYTYSLDIAKKTNILKLSTNILQQIYTKSKFLNINSSRLSIPKMLNINITQSTKIIDIVNNILKINPYISHRVESEENSYINIPINKTLILPPDGLNFYITADMNKFPLQITDSFLNVEYI